MNLMAPLLFFFLLSSLPIRPSSPTCTSYCGNLTVDYPFSLHDGCGHPIFRQLLFCIDGALLLHLPSGSYRLLSIDYAFRTLTLNDPTMSDCRSLSPNPSPPRGFVTLPSLARFLLPAPGNVFFLLGCRRSRDIPLVCGDVSGMSCEDFYRCPAWAYGAAPGFGECCAVGGGVLTEVNLTTLGCAAYSSAYRVAPVRATGAAAWEYGIRVGYSVPGEDDRACRACRVSGGACGYYDIDPKTTAEEDPYGGAAVLPRRLCICGGGGIGVWNSTSTCDSDGICNYICSQQNSKD